MRVLGWPTAPARKRPAYSPSCRPGKRDFAKQVNQNVEEREVWQECRLNSFTGNEEPWVAYQFADQVDLRVGADTAARS